MSEKIEIYKVSETGSLKINVDHRSRVVIHQGRGVRLEVTADHESEVGILQPGEAEPGTVKVNSWHDSRVHVKEIGS